MKYIKCPACGSKMNLRSGKWGEFYGCSLYPNCKYTVKMRDASMYTIEEKDRIEDDVDIASKGLMRDRIIKVSTDSPITILSDKEVDSSVFPYMKIKYEKINAVQAECMKYCDKDMNFVLAVPTSTGKTLVGEMFMAYSLRQGKRVAYISPLKALTQEKYDDWTDSEHEWSKKHISIVTGDYVLSDDRVKELNESDIVLLTCEMLCSRVRKIDSEKSEWIKDISTLIIDESSLICSGTRGAALEIGLIKFTKINPNCRIVFLSATMPNVIDMCGWLTSLNGKKTEMVNSDKRPIPLDIHWVTYDKVNGRGNMNEIKMIAAMDIVKEYPLDNFILFVHAKATGRKLKKLLEENDIPSEFHCADLSRDERARVEYMFRSKELKVLIATSTLAYGINI